jgi:hypothetical protein
MTYGYENPTFQVAFPKPIERYVFSEKKIITMSSVKHHDVVGKSSQWFCKDIVMFDWRHRDDFFVLL